MVIYLLPGLVYMMSFWIEPCYLSGYSIIERNIGLARRFIEHKRKTIDNIPIEQIKVNTQVHISLMAGLVDKDVEAEELEAYSEDV